VSDSENQNYGRFLHVIKKSIRSHQLEAMRAVNRELVALYWEIGKAIQRKQEQLGWGEVGGGEFGEGSAGGVSGKEWGLCA
jgi:hypothetical protein